MGLDLIQEATRKKITQVQRDFSLAPCALRPATNACKMPSSISLMTDSTTGERSRCGEMHDSNASTWAPCMMGFNGRRALAESVGLFARRTDSRLDRIGR